MPVILTERDVRQVLPMPDLIDAMARALSEFSAGRAVQPVRSVLEVGPEKAFFGVMPAALGAPPAVGAKLVTVYNGNHARGLPSHLATIVLMEPGDIALKSVARGRQGSFPEVRLQADTAAAPMILGPVAAGHERQFLGTATDAQPRQQVEQVRDSFPRDAQLLVILDHGRISTMPRRRPCRAHICCRTVSIL